MADANEGIELLPTQKPDSESAQGSTTVLVENEPESAIESRSSGTELPKEYKTTAEFLYFSGLDAWTNSKPWLTEFFDSAEFGIPEFSTLTRRISDNIEYFKPNYIIVAAICLAFTAFKDAFCFLLAACFLYVIDRKASAVKESNPEKLFVYIFLAGLTLVLTDTLYDVMMAAFYASVLIVVHSAAYKTERDLPAPATTSS